MVNRAWEIRRAWGINGASQVDARRGRPTRRLVEVGGSSSLGDRPARLVAHFLLRAPTASRSSSTPLLATLRLSPPSGTPWRAGNASLRTCAFKARGSGPSTLARAQLAAQLLLRTQKGLAFLSARSLPRRSLSGRSLPARRGGW